MLFLIAPNGLRTVDFLIKHRVYRKRPMASNKRHFGVLWQTNLSHFLNVYKFIRKQTTNHPTHSHEIEAKKTLCQRTRLRSVSMWTKMCYQLGSFDIDSIDFDSLCVCVFVWPIRIIQLIALTVRSVKAFCVSIDAWKHSLSPRNKHSESVVEARTLSLFENAHALRFISILHYSHQTVLFLLFFPHACISHHPGKLI